MVQVFRDRRQRGSKSRMRKAIACFVSFSLCSCGSSGGHTGHPSGENVSAMLVNNDPEACAAKDAINTALGAANQQYADYVKRGGEPLTVDTISATEIKKDIHEITCSAIAHYRMGGVSQLQSQPFEYKLRPTIDSSSSFVAEIPDTHQINGAIELQMMAGEPAPKQAAEQDLDTNLADASASAQPASQPSNEGPACQAQVLHDVSALEDKTAVMHAGQTWSDITQYWQNDKTGEAHFCAHGDYCYPARINVGGKQVEAIKLTNCSVGKKVDQDGDDQMFTVG